MTNQPGLSLASFARRNEPSTRSRTISARPLTSTLHIAALAVLASLAPAALPAQRATLPTRTPTLAASANTTLVDQGALPASAPITLTVRLALPADRTAALKQRLADQANPASSEYHQWLTPQQFATTFGATDDQVAATTAWLSAQSLTLSVVSAAHTTLTVQGPAAQVQAAFAVSLHQVQLAGSTYFANASQPSLPVEAQALIAGVSGLDNLPSTIALTGSTATDIPGALAAALEANTSPILILTGTTCDASVAQADVDTYTALFQQANAQGVTVLAASACPSGAFPASLGEVTAIALPGATAASPLLLAPRPTWQVAPGLLDDQLRREPDLTATSLSAFAQTIASLAASTGSRLGNINATLYELAPTAGLFTQPDNPAPGTWEPATGLGLIDLDKLIKVFPRGTGSSFTGIAASNYAPNHGANVIFTATVTSGTGGAIPTGNVTFATSTGTTLGSSALNAGGIATFTTNTFAGGDTTVIATYAGDTTYAASVSPSAKVSVTPESSVLSATISSGNVIGGTYTVTLTDTASSGVGHPTGTATVTLSGTTTSYSGPLVASTANSSVATITVPATIVGISTLSINCSGDASYSCNNPYTATVTVAKATPKLVLAYTPNPPVSGAALSFTATLAAVGTAAVPTGNVSFFDNGTTINAGKLANGTVTVAGTDITAATHVISATYDGDASYLAASATGATTTGTRTTTTALAPSATRNTGQAFTFTANITPSTVVSSTAPTGMVQFLDGTTALGTSTVASNAAALAIPSLSTTVAHTITAIYSGDTLYAASTSPAVTLSPAAGTTPSVTTITATPTTVTAGGTVTYAVTVAAASAGTTVPTGTVPTGTVTLTAGTVALGTVPLVNGAGALASTATLPAGPNVVTATYPGDTTYAASTGTANVTVSAATAVGTLTATVAPITGPYNTAAVVTATVAVATGTTIPTGATITANYSGIPGTYSGTLSSLGAAAITLPVPPPGTYNILVTCVTTTAFSCSNTVNLPFAATRSASSTSLGISPTTVVGGQVFSLTATVVPSPGATALTLTPTGTVTFFNNGAAIGTATINTSGVATRTTSLASAGTGVYTATYNGDTNYLTSTTASATSITATKFAPTVVFFSNGSPTLQGLNVLLTVQVTNFSAAAGSVPVPSGTVTFYDTSTGIPLALGTASLASNGVATGIAVFSTTGLSAGPHTINAVYGGDGNYLPVTSSTITIDVSDFQLSFNPGTLQITRGGSAATTITATAVDRFNGTITMACTPPADMQTTCTITPSTLSGGGQATLTITTTAPGKAVPAGPQAINKPGPWGWRLGTGSMLSMLFFFGIPAHCRRRLRPIVIIGLALFATGITANIGCGNSVSTASQPVSTGTPLGTALFTVTAQGQETIGTNRHNSPLQVTINP